MTLIESSLTVSLMALISGVAIETIDFEAVMADATVKANGYHFSSMAHSINFAENRGEDLDYSTPESLLISLEEAGYMVVEDPARAGTILEEKWHIIQKLERK